MKKIGLLLAALCCAAGLLASDFLPVNFSKDWSYYHKPVEKYDNWDPSEVTAVTETIGNAKREIVQLKSNGCFLHNNKSGWTTGLLVNEFESEKAGNMLMRCGASAFRMKVAINGKMIFESRLSSTVRRFGKAGTHDIVLPVQKGKNILAITFLGAEFAVNQGDPAIYHATLPTREHFNAIQYAEFGSWRRILDETIIRNGVDQITIPIFNKIAHHPELTAEEAEKIYQEYPVLEFYDKALDKVLKELPETKVEKGIVIWHLFNMGHVVKTPESTFGIDIYHRRSTLLVPYLDFAIISHAHGDHNDKHFFDAMEAAGKKVFNNFRPKDTPNPPAEAKIKDVEMRFEATDHNKNLPRYICTSQITCGKGDDAVVIYHTGDSCNQEQFRPTRKIDVCIVHSRVGLSVPRTVELLKPREIWFSHLLEMGHCKPSIWRPVDFVEVHSDVKIFKQRKDPVIPRMPMWGEKFHILPAAK